MDGFEDRLNSILGNPEAMGQIMALARSLNAPEGSPPPDGETGKDREESPPEPAGEEEPADRPRPRERESEADGPDLSALLGQLDPAMLRLGGRLLREMQGSESRNAALLQALRPFLREDRRERLDRALQLARVTRLIRVALGALAGKEGEGSV